MLRPTVPFVDSLAAFGERPAVIAADTTVSYRELDARARELAGLLRPEGPRRLVLVGAANRLDALVAYLAALAANHVVLLADANDPRAIDTLVDRYDPDVVLAPSAPADVAWALAERRPGAAHDLHPDLALLLSTSGSTGSPKLVRLSHLNMESNARAIAAYLEIGPEDRAATTLPMQYSYGLSVINSHLASGASLLLTELSVVDRCLWDRFRDVRATSFAGVPYTFELLDRIGFADLDLPTLRYVTQAGGRLAPERVRAYAELGRTRGWRLFVMYGQTEATARMAYLPPELATTHPHAIGGPIPGGAFRIEPVPEAPPDAGELVYRGPSVMLGYAEHPADLARGRDLDELRTGDLARAAGPGLYELVGRRSAVVKVAGLRVDLGQVERNLDAVGLRACCAGRDDELVVAVETDGSPGDLRPLVLETLDLPGRAVRVLALPELPRRPNGKLDRARVLELADEPERIEPAGGAAPPGLPVHALPVHTLYAGILERDVTDRDSFASLGGDSLSYVQASLGLEEILGRLPEGWPSMPVRELERLADARQVEAAPLAPSAPASRPRPLPRVAGALALRAVETTVALRALAIICIVGTHVGLIDILGGAHVLLAVAGFNFARFQLTDAPRRARLRSQIRSIARIVVPTVLWIGAALLFANDYALHNLFLLNPIVGPPPFSSTWHFWFIELLVYILVAMAVLLSVPAIDRFERRRPFLLALAVLGVGLAFRFHLLEFGILQSRPVLWLFALGWAAYLARTRWQRGLLIVVAAAAAPGFYFDLQRELVILAGIVLLVAVRSVRVPALLTPAVGVLASASLFVYLVHWQVYPHLEDTSQLLAVLASLAAGVAAWAASSRIARALGRLGRAGWRPERPRLARLLIKEA